MSNLKRKQAATIFVIDDKPNNIRLLVDFLSEYQFKVLVADDGAEAVEMIAQAQPDLCLIDIMMPGIDGFETCARLKSNPLTKHIPIIFMSALSDTPNVVQGLKLGAVDYITKPFQQEEVVARVRTHLALVDLQQKMASANAELQQSNQKLEQLNTNILQLNQQLINEIKERENAQKNLIEVNEKLLSFAHIDGLTNVPNRRRQDEYLQQIWQSMSATGAKMSLILCDIDYFKHYNDFYGHLVGDQCLQSVAQVLLSAVRTSNDMVSRFGGEEFTVIMPDTSINEALEVAHRIKSELHRVALEHETSPISAFVTFSMGVACLQPQLSQSPLTLIDMADQALYQAKGKGRNAIILHQL